MGGERKIHANIPSLSQECDTHICLWNMCVPPQTLVTHSVTRVMLKKTWPTCQDSKQVKGYFYFQIIANIQFQLSSVLLRNMGNPECSIQKTNTGGTSELLQRTLVHLFEQVVTPGGKTPYSVVLLQRKPGCSVTQGRQVETGACPSWWSLFNS